MKNKILILGTSEEGGVTIYVSNLIKKIKEFEFYIPISGNSNQTNLRSLFPYVSFVEINQNFSLRTLRATLNSLNRIIKSNNINIIHAHTLRAGSFAAIYKMFFQSQIILVYTGHGLRYTQKDKWVEKLIFKLIEKFTNFFCHKVIFIRESEYNIALKEKIVQTTKAEFIRTQILKKDNNTKKIDIRTKYHINTKYILANAASIYDLKNPDLFINIAKIILKKNSDVTFLWFGNGIEINNINDGLIFENLQQKIMFVGPVEPDLMLNIYSQIDGFLLTSKIETFPLVILESYLSKTLVFCTNFLGSNEIVINNETGFIFDMDKPNEAATKILDILLNPILSSRITEQATRFFNQNFNNYDKFVFEHLKLYRNLQNDNC
jgi:glycosyltransferase involved in cell wall biosynthesis